MAGQPYDYRLKYVDPTQALIQGIQDGQTLRTNDMQIKAAQQKAQDDQLAAQQKAQDDKLAAQQKAMREQQRQDLVAKYLTTGDSSMLPNIIMQFPEMRESVDTMVKVKGDAYKQDQTSFFARVVPALKSGRGDVALDVIKTRVSALEQSGSDPQQLETLKTAQKALESGDQNAIRQISALAELSLAAYDDKYAASIAKMNEDQREQQLHPYNVSKAQHSAELERVKAANEQRRADAEIRLRDAQTAGAIDATQADFARVALQAAELKIKQSAERREQAKAASAVAGNPVIKLNASQQKIINDDVEASVAALNSATTAEQLSKVLKQQDSDGGVIKGAWLRGLALAGFDVEEVAIAKQVDRIVLTGMLQNLPPGPATDKDIQLVAKGFPQQSASDQAKADFLDSFARVQRNISLAKDLKVAWISANGHVGTLSRDIEFDGKIYAAGTTYGQALKRQGAAK